MHDRLEKSDFLDRHVVKILRDGRPDPRPNKKFGLFNFNRDSSPVRIYARKRFRESLVGILTRVQYKTPDYTAPDELG